MLWEINIDGDVLTQKYVNDNMPEGTTEIRISGGVKEIGHDAFSGRDNLIAVNIPASTEKIGMRAFQNCSSLQRVNISGVKTICSSAFEGCQSLQGINIPNSVTNIEYKAFASSGLVSLVMPNSIEDIDMSVFYNCCNLRTVNLSHSLKTIPIGVFESCSSLEHINIPDSVTYIGNTALKGCGLRQLIIPDSVTSIGDQAFRDCSELSAAYIPESVKRLERFTFNQCRSLQVVIISNETERDAEIFNNVTIIEPSVIHDFQHAHHCETLQEAITYYRLSTIEALQVQHFHDMPHLSVADVLNVIQIHHKMHRNDNQTTGLLRWVMGSHFVDSCGGMEVSAMFGKARGGYDCAPSNTQQFLTVKDFANMRSASRSLSQSPAAIFQTNASPASAPDGASAAGPNSSSSSREHDGSGAADSDSKGPSSGKV